MTISGVGPIVSVAFKAKKDAIEKAQAPSSN
jgi:hypothetical protein